MSKSIRPSSSTQVPEPVLGLPRGPSTHCHFYDSEARSKAWVSTTKDSISSARSEEQR
jgi:hypothetical protein